jgi:hypothetical protein
VPYDLWIRSNRIPAAFEPEHLTTPATIANRYEAREVALGYLAADREVVILEVDDARVVVDGALSADERAAIITSEVAMHGPSVVFAWGNELPIAIALDSVGRFAPNVPAARSASAAGAASSSAGAP